MYKQECSSIFSFVLKLLKNTDHIWQRSGFFFSLFALFFFSQEYGKFLFFNNNWLLKIITNCLEKKNLFVAFQFRSRFSEKKNNVKFLIRFLSKISIRESKDTNVCENLVRTAYISGIAIHENNILQLSFFFIQKTVRSL